VALGRDLIKKMMEPVPDAARPYLKRLDLDAPKTMKEKMMQKVVLLALEGAKAI